MDPLDRFVEAQEGVYEDALAELRAGCKQTHWMWFVFPQVVGLGHSPMAQRYAIADLAEARAYLAHPLLGPRLLTCVEAVLQHRNQSAREMLGPPDDIKLRSSMTLFLEASGDPRFQAVLDRFFDGRPDEATLQRRGRRS